MVCLAPRVSVPVAAVVLGLPRNWHSLVVVLLCWPVRIVRVRLVWGVALVLSVSLDWFVGLDLRVGLDWSVRLDWGIGLYWCVRLDWCLVRVDGGLDVVVLYSWCVVLQNKKGYLFTNPYRYTYNKN